jgi:TorA maturation chaperone TorD
MSNKGDIQVFLAGRAGAYRILQGLFGNEPSKDSLQDLAGQPVKDILGLFALGDAVEYERALAVFLQFVEKIHDDDQAINQMEVDFTRLFVGPGAVEANPWESVYATNEKVLFQATTLEVRKAYVAQGLIPQSYPRVADDHIALELDFMALLGENLADAYGKDDIGKSLEYFKASENFLKDHLLKFVPDFVAALQQAKHNYFYREAGEFLSEFLRVDAEALNEIRPLLEG